jgi:serine/threonine protein kinase
MTGQIIKDYIFEKEIGKGGMATVYLAMDKKFQTNVAVKVLNKEFVHNENIRHRFLAEARNMYRMNHPNVIKVTDLIDDGEFVAFVMEYAEGQTLKEYLESKGKNSDQEIKRLFTQMLAAVGYVHEQGFVHRDIKPSNFMINKKGDIRLLDFGIAKNTDITSAEYTMTGTTQNMGTPIYMSPEQIKSSKDVQAPSDIYSMGVVLWQMVTGKKPYDSQTLSTFDIQTKIVNEPLSLTGTEWDTIIKKATQKEISNRYPAIKNFQQDVSVLDDQSDKTQFLQPVEERTVIEKQPAYSATPAEILKTSNKSNRWLIFIGVAIVALSIGAYLLFFKGTKNKSDGAIQSLTEPNILSFLDQWLNAQNQKNLVTYESFYAPDFQGIKRVKNGQKYYYNHDEWIQDRTKMYNSARNLTMTVSNVKISNNTGIKATVEFTHGYSSDAYKDIGEKQLQIEKGSDGRIIIVREEMLNSYDPNTTEVHNGVSYISSQGKLVYGSDCFVIITGSFANETDAKNDVQRIRNEGYSNAGYLWIPDYPSLSGLQLYAPFIGPFQTYEECEKNLRTLPKTGRFWYGIKISYDNTRVEIR